MGFPATMGFEMGKWSCQVFRPVERPRVAGPQPLLRLAAVIVCLGAALLALPSARAATVLDQSFEGGGGWLNVSYGNFAQTFTVRVTGTLDSVEVFIGSGYPGSTTPVTLQIRSTTDSGAPSYTVLASVVLPPTIGWAHADVSSANLPVTVGQQLAIVLLGSQVWVGWACGQDAYGGISATYEGGAGYFDCGPFWWRMGPPGGANTDFQFRTYVTLPDPAEIAADILDFMNEAKADGTLTGSGPGRSADNRFNALVNMIDAARGLIELGLIDDARAQLHSALLHTDGQPRPPDFVTGPAASALADQILELLALLESG